MPSACDPRFRRRMRAIWVPVQLQEWRCLPPGGGRPRPPSGSNARRSSSSGPRRDVRTPLRCAYGNREPMQEGQVVAQKACTSTGSPRRRRRAFGPQRPRRGAWRCDASPRPRGWPCPAESLAGAAAPRRHGRGRPCEGARRLPDVLGHVDEVQDDQQRHVSGGALREEPIDLRLVDIDQGHPRLPVPGIAGAPPRRTARR
jgi:hypothetical protein